MPKDQHTDTQLSGLQAEKSFWLRFNRFIWATIQTVLKAKFCAHTHTKNENGAVKIQLAGNWWLETEKFKFSFVSFCGRYLCRGHSIVPGGWTSVCPLNPDTSVRSFETSMCVFKSEGQSRSETEATANRSLSPFYRSSLEKFIKR